MITNPGNPTGTCLTRDEMKMILDVAVEHDLYLIADEVYREFAMRRASCCRSCNSAMAMKI